MHDTSTSAAPWRRTIPDSVKWSIIVVMGGIIWTLAGRSSQLDTMTTQLAVISGQISKLSDNYNATDKIVAIQINEIKTIEQHMDRMEAHLSANDERLSRLEK